MRSHRRQPTRLPRPWDSPGKNTGVGCHFLLQCMKVKSESEVAQSCPTLSDPMDYSLPGSSVHGIFQARVLEWGAIAWTSLIFSSFTFQKVKSLGEAVEVLENWRRTATRTWWKELWEHLNLGPGGTRAGTLSRRQGQEGVLTVFILPKPVSVPALIKWSIKGEGINKYINGCSSAPKRPPAAIRYQLVMSLSCVM